VTQPATQALAETIGDLVDRARTLVRTFDEEVWSALPTGSYLFDAHVHLGHDSDGMVAELPELLAMLDRYGISHVFAFCLDEPDREPAFRAGNDRTLEHARSSGGRIIPFARLDLAHDPVPEARRCLDRGAGGIKLHPRAQSFALDDDRLASVFAVAAAYGVPVLIHGGQGLPPVADDLGRLIDAQPGAQLIIAHAGVADLHALASRFAGTPGVFFDTATWSALDLVDLFRRVPPEQVLYASDYPYGQQPSALFNTLRAARFSGLGERELRGVLGETAGRIARGEQPTEPTAPAGSTLVPQPVALARLHQYLSMAAPLLWRQRRDSIGIFDLAISACADDSLEHVDFARLRSMLEIAQALWSALPDLPSYADRRVAARSAIQLIQLADIVAVTTPVTSVG
jgi:predicted TIM-barrel fold metal-dependent hydrolase